MTKFTFKGNIIILFVFINSFNASKNDKCCDASTKKFNYHLLSRNSRFNGSILSQKHFSTLDECQNYSKLKNGLAFNFYTKKNASKFIFNCQILKCPKIYLTNHLIKSKGWKYYTLYSKKTFIMLKNQSVVCLPSVGLFVLSEELKNYSLAQQMCIKVHGKLAHVASAERSVGLAKFIVRPAYVGLSKRNRDERLWRNELDEPLSCFDYRGWARGEPAGSRGCVVLKNATKIIQSTWHVVPCSRKFPFICEVLPQLL